MPFDDHWTLVNGGPTGNGDSEPGGEWRRVAQTTVSSEQSLTTFLWCATRKLCFRQQFGLLFTNE